MNIMTEPFKETGYQKIRFPVRDSDVAESQFSMPKVAKLKCNDVKNR
jgi:hypothetical protein